MLEELLDLVFGKDEVEETVELPALRAVHTAVTDKNVRETGEASEPGTVDGSWTTTDAQAEPETEDTSWREMGVRAEPGTVDALRKEMDARAEPGTVDALRKEMDARAEPGTVDALRKEMDARAEPGTVDALRKEMDARVEPGTVDALRKEMDARAELGTVDALRKEMDARVEPGTVDALRRKMDARAEPGTADALRRKMGARAEPGTADALRRKMGAQAEPGTADGLWTEPTEMNCRTTFEGVVRTVEVEDAWSEEETAAEGAAELLAQIPVSGSPKAPHTAETEKSQLPAVGDPVDRLLEWVSGVLTRESGEGMGVEMGLKGAWTAPVEAFRQETAAERLYGQVNAAWLRENGSGEHSVVVSMNGETTGDGLSLREIDRAFQRDARRYDGGLNLL